MNDDSKLIFEKYNEIHEGIFSRGKAQVAGAVGAVKGLGDRIAGTVKGGMAGLKGDVKGVKTANAQRQAGANAGMNAKVESYKKTVNDKIENLMNEFKTDATKLGIADENKIGTNLMNFRVNMERAASYFIETLINPNQPAQTTQQPPKRTAPPKKPAAPTSQPPPAASPTP